MMDHQICANVLLAVAYVMLAIGIFWSLFYPYHWKSTWRARRGYVFIICLALSVLCLVAGYVVKVSQNFSFESLVKGISTFLQFFSLDADYACVANALKDVFPSATWLFGALIVIETFLAPVAGACFIGQLLFSFIPRWRLFINYKKTKFIFSELNERSIALAEDIARLSWQLSFRRRRRYDFKEEKIDIKEKKWLKSACIIFTDAYSDERSEISSELLTRAKRIGAICLKDDILERPIYFLNSRKRKVIIVSEESDYDLVLASDNSVAFRFKGAESILELDKGWRLIKLKSSSKKARGK